ncbi:MAG: lytic transglycosylase domain-containing protein [Oligoflexia bacterium]|nr:lytic transglycosylase domain-containing protein [Oligoflexia bacterium]
MGILKKTLLIFLFCISSYANNYRSNIGKILDPIKSPKNAKIDFVNHRQLFSEYESDPKNKISADFNVPAGLKDNVEFWFSIYTQYTSDNSVFHDKRDLSIIYEVLDFSNLRKAVLNKYTKFSLQNKMALDHVKSYRKAFSNLAVDKRTGSKIEKQILKALKDAKKTIPKNKNKRKKFFRKLSDNLRAQTGQKDNVQNGLSNFATFEKTFFEIIDYFEMPRELFAITFLESSFNLHAKSKVGATGPWQFMRRVGRYFMRVDKYADQRKNPYISTVAALHLLAQNKKILKRWDLAVSAYNNGTGLILKAVRKMRKRKNVKNWPSISEVIDSYENPNFGFASKNFYASFLALVHALAYKTDFYQIPKAQDTIIKAYVTKCTLNIRNILNILGKNQKDIRVLNSHFNKRYKNAAKGSIIVSRTELTDKRYRKLALKDLRRRYPKNWKKRVRNQSCSTK